MEAAAALDFSSSQHIPAGNDYIPAITLALIPVSPARYKIMRLYYGQTAKTCTGRYWLFAALFLQTTAAFPGPPNVSTGKVNEISTRAFATVHMPIAISSIVWDKTKVFSDGKAPVSLTYFYFSMFCSQGSPP